MQKLKNQFILLTLITMALQLSIGTFLEAEAAVIAPVVINEVAWAGTPDGSNDEWIELYNTGSEPIDLSNWIIDDDNGDSLYKIPSGSIDAHGYFVIADSADTLKNFQAGTVIGMSLANTGDSLVLKNSTDVVIDSVNVSGGAWYAGNSTSKATMERLDPSVNGDEKTNWASAILGNGTSGRSNSPILGTPGSVNSVFVGTKTEVSLNLIGTTVGSGEIIKVSGKISDVNDFYAYGLEISYDPLLFTFISSAEGDFLKNDGKTTSFHAALKDGKEGTLIIADARIVNPPTGVTGSGEIFNLQFKVIGTTGKSGAFSFKSGSFVSDTASDIPAKFSAPTIEIAEAATISPVSNLLVTTGEERYSFELKWDAISGGADKYLIFRKLPGGKFEQIGESTRTDFIDSDSLTKGGKIVPNLKYEYEVIAVKNDILSAPVIIEAIDERGIVGDNNRNDQVDGRDLERLARKFGSAFSDTNYDPLLDTNFDGVIDGSDLIDIGANFGKIYKQT